MFGTWASYESTRAFVTSSFLWQRRGSDFQTATLAAWQPSNRLHITLSNDAIQQKARTAFYFNRADDAPFVGDLANTPNTRKTHAKRAQVLRDNHSIGLFARRFRRTGDFRSARRNGGTGRLRRTGDSRGTGSRRSCRCAQIRPAIRALRNAGVIHCSAIGALDR